MDESYTCQECRLAFNKMYSDDKYENIDAKIEYWLSKGGLCSGTGAYEYQLGRLYTHAKEYLKAEAVFLYGLRLKTKFTRDLKFGLAEILLHKRQYKIALEQFKKLQSEFVEWHIPYQRIGQIYIDLNDKKKAIWNLEKSNQVSPCGETYAVLAIAYYNDKQFDKSVEAMHTAIEEDVNMARHRQAVYAAVMSSFERKRYRESGKILFYLYQQESSVLEDPVFQKLALMLEDYIVH